MLAPEHACIPCVTALLVLLRKVLRHQHYLAGLMLQGSSGRTVWHAPANLLSYIVVDHRMYCRPQTSMHCLGSG